MLVSRSYGGTFSTASPWSRIRPSVGHLEAGEHPQRRRLAAARRAQQREELALGDREAHVVHRDEVAEALRHVLEPDRLARRRFHRRCRFHLTPIPRLPSVPSARSRACRTAAAESPRARSRVSDTTIISVPIALIVGSSPNRIADQIRTGSGCSVLAGREEREHEVVEREREDQQAGRHTGGPQRRHQRPGGPTASGWRRGPSPPPRPPRRSRPCGRGRRSSRRRSRT